MEVHGDAVETVVGLVLIGCKRVLTALGHPYNLIPVGSCRARRAYFGWRGARSVACSRLMFGTRMIAWLLTTEVQGKLHRDYLRHGWTRFGWSKSAMLSALILHEIAHAAQLVCYPYRTKSHGKEFYYQLDKLMVEYMPDLIQFFNYQLPGFGDEPASLPKYVKTPTTSRVYYTTTGEQVVPPRFSRFDRVCFQFGGQVMKGLVLSAKGPGRIRVETDDGGSYKVPRHLLTKI